jgi:tetratricopeptide (TPR) repeat protein
MANAAGVAVGIHRLCINEAERLRDEEAVRRHQRSIVTIYQRRAQQAPNDAHALNDYAWETIESPARQPADVPIALEMATKACELSDYKNPKFVDTLAKAAALSGDPEKAKTNFERAISLWDEQLSADPKHRQLRVEAALQRVRFGEFLAGRADRETARALFEHALESFEILATEYSDDKYYAEWMLWLNGRLAFLFEEMNEPVLAERHHREVLNVYDTRIKPPTSSLVELVRRAVTSDSRREEYAQRLTKYEKQKNEDVGSVKVEKPDAATASLAPADPPTDPTAEKKVEIEDPLLFDD